VLLGVKTVHDLDGVGKVLVGKIPDPLRPVAEHGATGGRVEPAASSLALDTSRKFARYFVGIPLRCALDRSRVTDRAGVALRCALLVARLGTPDRDQLHLARLARTIRLFAGAALDFGSTHRHAGAVHAQVQRRCDRLVRWRRLDGAPLVVGDFATERLGAALDVLGRHVHTSKFVQKLVALSEADHGADQPDHARDRR
jgi:hypothetical protein